MTRLSFDTSIPLQSLDTLSASGPLSEAAAHDPGSFNDLLHQATQAANAASDETARTTSPKRSPAASNSRRASSPQSDQAGTSQGTSASPVPSSADASLPGAGSTDGPSDKTADKSPAVSQDASGSAASAVSLAAAGTQAAAASSASSPTSPSGTPAQRPARIVAPPPKLIVPRLTIRRRRAGPAPALQSRQQPARRSSAAKKADGNPADATVKVSAAAIAQSVPETSGPPCPSQDTAARTATASAQSVVQDGARAAAQTATTSIAAADGAADATQPATGDAAPSVTGSLAGQDASAAGAGKSAADRRGIALKASTVDPDASTAQSGGSMESAVVGMVADPRNQPGSANPVGTIPSTAATFDLPVATDRAKSNASPVAVKNSASPTTDQAQGPLTLGTPATNATGQATAAPQPRARQGR